MNIFYVIYAKSMKAHSNRPSSFFRVKIAHIFTPNSYAVSYSREGGEADTLAR
jgi:hypothetical protein